MLKNRVLLIKWWYLAYFSDSLRDITRDITRTWGTENSFTNASGVTTLIGSSRTSTPICLYPGRPWPREEGGGLVASIQWHLLTDPSVKGRQLSNSTSTRRQISCLLRQDVEFHSMKNRGDRNEYQITVWNKMHTCRITDALKYWSSNFFRNRMFRNS